MKFLLTGGAGFVGSHLLDQLVDRGDSVIVLDDFSTGRKENIAHHIQHKAVEVIEGSILDAYLVDQLVSKSDRVFHLAAAVGVFNIVKHPLEGLTTNIKGSENVFDACLKHNKPVLITSSSEVYGKNTSDLLSEDSDRVVGAPQKIRWSYSDAKAIDEAMAIALHQQKGLETRIVRLFNTVGPRQIGRYGMVVPRFVEAALKNEPLTIYGTGKQTRCFGHVSDVIDAILKVDSCIEAIGKPVNIGVNQEISILELAKKIIERTSSKSTIEHQSYEDAYAQGFEDMERRVPDNAFLKQLTDWSPVKNIENIIDDLAAHLA
ncbi:MAG: NAD-dependent epimerase/dehydratase family protein [Sphingomonadales bacterium]|nr:NAD-dependent epimerase/dehydratase family protein [Sphingomonadales bacterium]